MSTWSESAERRPCTVVGVLAEPEAAAAELGRHLGEVLPGLLAERRDGGRGWAVRVCNERLPGGDLGTHDEMVEYGARRRAELGWDLAVCVTDLPLRDGKQPLVADVASGRGIVLVSLPAFGATRLRRRVTEVVRELVIDLAAFAEDGARADAGPIGTARDLPGPFRVVTPDVSGIDARVVASRGRWRLLVGRVRDNRPWRLLLGLRGAIVAAFAFSAFWVINPMIWQLSAAQSAWRLVLISLGTVTAMVVWLIVYHELWVRTARDDPTTREQVVLFNASTVLTLLIGVGCAYLGLLTVNFGAANLVIPRQILAEQLQAPVGLADYALLTWLATSGASVAGALGTGFESEQSVREAAYSRREQERRARFKEDESRSSDQTAGPAADGGAS